MVHGAGLHTRIRIRSLRTPWGHFKSSSATLRTLGIFAVLLLGSLGVPIPEEMPTIAAAVLSHEGIVWWWLVLPVCLLGCYPAIWCSSGSADTGVRRPSTGGWFGWSCHPLGSNG
jgi:hypothetical protein